MWKNRQRVEENHLAQQLQWLLKNAHFSNDEESPTKNDNEKKATLLT